MNIITAETVDVRSRGAGNLASIDYSYGDYDEATK